MSLINDMLRDLEARRAAEQRLPAGMLHGMGSHAPARRRRRTLIIILAAALVLLSAAVIWLAWQRYAAPPPVAAPANAPSAAPVSAPPAAAPAPPPAPPAVAEPMAAAPQPTPPAPIDAAAHVPATPSATPLRPVAPAPAAAPAPEAAAQVEITARAPTPGQQAETEYQRGVSALRGGNPAAAESAFRAALRLDGEHLLARETLAAMLLGAGRLVEAEEVLEQGRRFFARNPTLALLLARLHLEQGQTGAAVTVLEQSLHGATARADYLAFLAALYQRELRYDESIESYGRALALQPQQAGWWAGMGISLENAGRRADAVKAYEQAAAGSLPPQLQEHVRNRLKALQQ